MRRELLILLLFVLVFLGAYFLPTGWLIESLGEKQPLSQAGLLLQEYAREHVLLCLVPALFIAGAIGVFLSQAGVMRYLGARAKLVLAYAVASVSGAVLAVCSCTILPLFAGIYRMGAGLGPATAFLYSGPAINVLAILLTARILGAEFGLARAAFAIGFGVVIGVLMQLSFRKDAERRAEAVAQEIPVQESAGGALANFLLLGGLTGCLVFATWPTQSDTAFFADIAPYKWILALSALGVALLSFLIWKRDQGEEWLDQTWTLAKQILPLLFVGVLVSGIVFGTPSAEGLIPRSWITESVGGNSLAANLIAALSGLAELAGDPRRARHPQDPGLCLLRRGARDNRRQDLWQHDRSRRKLMSRVQILGTGCAKCEKLAQRAREVLDGLGSDAELVKVKEIEDIVALGAMLTPALAVDDKVLLAGRVPSTKELSQILSDALASGGSSS